MVTVEYIFPFKKRKKGKCLASCLFSSFHNQLISDNSANLLLCKLFFDSLISSHNSQHDNVYHELEDYVLAASHLTNRL